MKSMINQLNIQSTVTRKIQRNEMKKEVNKIDSWEQKKKILKNVYIDALSSNHIKWQMRFFEFYMTWFLCSQISTNYCYVILFSSKFFALFEFFEMTVFLSLLLQLLSYLNLILHHAWWSNIWLKFWLLHLIIFIVDVFWSHILILEIDIQNNLIWF